MSGPVQCVCAARAAVVYIPSRGRRNTPAAGGGGGAAMQGDFTWESDMFRCALCMHLYTADGDRTPMVICANIHTACRQCLERLRPGGAGSCPNCRDPLWKHDAVNRDLVALMAGVRLRCGACESPQLMGNAAAVRHAAECTGTHAACPMFVHETSGAACQTHTRVADMWEHCQQFHNAGKDVQAAVVTLEPDGSHTASATFSVALRHNLSLYATAATPARTYHLCVHVLRHTGADRAESVVVYVRRFFPGLLLREHPVLVSIEVGAFGGAVLYLPELSSCHARIQDVLDGAAELRSRHAIQLPVGALAQMHERAPAASEDLHMAVSVQFRLEPASAAP